MTLPELLDGHRDAILDEAVETLVRTRLPHYDAQGAAAARDKLAQLYDLMVACVRDRDLRPMLQHARGIARERFDAGFDLREIQTAFNVLEEAAWKRVIAEVATEQLAEAIGLVSTVHGAGKDEVARTYVELATRQHVPSVDLRALLRG